MSSSTEDITAQKIITAGTVQFAQSGVSKRAAVNAGEDVAVLGMLMIVTAGKPSTAVSPDASSVHIVWVPYSFLATFQPRLLSPTAQQIVASANGGGAALSPDQERQREELQSFERGCTVCVALSSVEKVHRKTNIRGRRTLIVQRANRVAADSPLGFGEGGSTQFFDKLRDFVELAPLPTEGREAFRVVPVAPRNTAVGAASGDGGPDGTTSGKPTARGAGEVSASGQASDPVTVAVPVSPGPRSSGAPSSTQQHLHADPTSPADAANSQASMASSIAPRAAPPAAAGGNSSASAVTSQKNADGANANAAEAAADSKEERELREAFRRDMYGQQPKRGFFGAVLRGGSRIAEAVTTQLDRLVADSPTAADESGRAESEYDMMEPLQGVEKLVPLIVPPPNAPRFGQPLRPSLWNGCFDNDGRLNPANYAAARETAFRGGIDPSIRHEVWPFLLGLYPFDSTAEDRSRIREAHAAQYRTIKAQWTSISDEQAENFAAYRERRVGVEKDVVRTDRRLPQFQNDDSPLLKSLFNVLMTYSFYNFDIGYCQGMSDFLAPILVMYEEEEMSFAVFKHLMANRCAGNFYNDHRHNMHKQLESLKTLVRAFVPPLWQHLEYHGAEAMTFAFRWLLVYFKREIPIQSIPQLWDVLFACPFTPQYEIFMAAALLRAMSKQIIDNALGADDLVRFCNAVAGNVRVEDLVVMTADFYDGIAQQMSWRRKTQGAAGGATPGVPASPGTKAGASRGQRPSLSDVVKEYTAAAAAPAAGANSGTKR